MKQLKQLYSSEEKTKPKLRLLCAICRKEGGSLDDVAARVSMKRRTAMKSSGVLTREAVKGKIV